jgi:metal-responsive CopG/Arc/MetJ family transcriptional regulator
MRTVVSIPDELLAAADALAARLGMSRSEFFAAALADIIAKRAADDRTERLDALFATEDSALDPALRRAQAQAIGPEEW